MKYLCAVFLVLLGLAPASAQAPRVKTGYEVPGPLCYYRAVNGRVIPVDCLHWRRVFIRIRDNGGNGGGE